MPDLSLFLLGPTQITLDDHPVAFRTNKVLALLCYLAVETTRHPGIAFRRELLMDLLWPQMPLKSAQDNFRQTLYQLRKTIPKTAARDSANPKPFIHSDRLTVQINPNSIFELDMSDFQAHIAAKSEPARLEQAAALYRGNFLDDLYLSDSNDFEDWAAAKRLELQNQMLNALDSLTKYFTNQERYKKAESFARRQLEIDNLRENAYQQLMVILVKDGRRHEALQQYESCRDLLLEELGIVPSAEITALYEQIRSSTGPPHSTASLITPDTKPRRHNLPAQTTSFIGRQKELAKILNLLMDSNCRLLTVLGPGGTGKTRLSLQAASTLAQSSDEILPDGVFFVPLEAVPTIEHLVPAIAEAVGFSYSGPREPKMQLLAYLKAKNMLLVLDNLEHLAGESGLLAEFLTAVPGLTFLVTSRTRLNLYEEWLFELKGLEVPSEAEAVNLENFSAVQLFLQRARQAGQELSLEENLPVIGHICQLLDGLPLGIELAASRIRTHSCAQIAAELEQNLKFLTTTIQNIPQRHRSLQAAFEHSWRLLSSEEQQIFAGLSVFQGGFTKQAAESVTDGSDVLLAQLVNNSMIFVSSGRFQMNEPLRQIGAEKMAADEGAEVRERHADYFGSYLEKREQSRWTAEEPTALDEIGIELKNILAGWHWATSRLDTPDNQKASLALLSGYTTMLAYFYEQRSRFHEGVRLFQQAAKIIKDVRETAGQSDFASNELALVQAASATLGFHLGQFTQAEALLMNSLATFREKGSREKTAASLIQLGMIHNRLGAFDKANRHLKESLSLFQEMNARVASAESLNGLGIIAISEERFEDAQALLKECLTIYEDTGYQRGIARALSNLGTASIRSGNFNQGLSLYEAALRAARKINDFMVIAIVLCNLGSASKNLEKYEDSLRYYEESLAMFLEIDERRWLAVTLNGLGETLLDMGQIEPAKARLRQSLEISTAIQSVPDSLDSLSALGEIQTKSGHLEKAAVTLTFVVEHPVTKPLARERGKRALVQVKNELPPDLWEAAKDEGENDSLERLTAEFINQIGAV